MSSRPMNGSTTMSWIAITAIVVAFSLACAFALSEWVAGRRRADRGDDRSAMG